MSATNCARCGSPELPGGKCHDHWNAGVPDPIADTARALAGLYAEATAAHDTAERHGYLFRACDALTRMAAIADAARACGPQVLAAFNALVTGDAARAPGVKP